MLAPIVIWGVTAPLLISAVLAALLARPWSARPWSAQGDHMVVGSRLQRCAAACALAIAYLAAHLGLAGRPWAPGADSGRLLAYVACLGLLASLGCPQRNHKLWRWLWRLLFAAGTTFMLLRPLWRQGWTLAHGLAALSSSSAAMLLAWLCSALVAERELGLSLVLAWIVLFAGTALALVFSGTATLGQLAGVMAAALGGIFLVLWAYKRQIKPALLASAVPSVALFLGSFCSLGQHYAEMSTSCFLSLSIAPLGLLVDYLPWLKGLAQTPRVMVRLATVALLVGLAVASAGFSYVHPESSTSGAPSSGSQPVQKGATDYSYGY